jgi:hypothetical protein
MNVRVATGFTYSYDALAPVAKKAGVTLLSLSELQKAMPGFVMPSFETDHAAAVAALNTLLRDGKFGVFWPNALSAYDLSGVTACPVHAVTTPEWYALINNKRRLGNWQDEKSDPTRPKSVETFGADATLAAIGEAIKVYGAAFTKPDNGVNGKDCWMVKPEANVLSRPDDRTMSPEVYKLALRAHEAEYGPRHWLVQEPLQGDELSIDVLAIHGESRKWMVRKKVSGSRQMVYADHPVMEHVRWFIKTWGLHGLVSAQYMFDQDGNPKMLEANLRASGGCLTYGEAIFDKIGSTSLVYDWLQWLAGLISADEIKHWSGYTGFDKESVAVML